MSGVAKATTKVRGNEGSETLLRVGPPKKRAAARLGGQTKSSSMVWHLKAACRGPNQTVFYPPPQLERRLDRRRREARAKEICSECPVQADCLDYAFQIREQHGIWGGLTEKERRLLIAQGEG